MAVVQNPLIGRSRGKIGGAVFSSWKGLNVLKTKAESVEQPNTVAQQTQKNRMALMVQFARAAKPVIDIGYKEQAINKSEFNAFIGDNIMSATAAPTPPTVEPDFTELKYSKGSLSDTAIDSIASADASADVTLSYSTALEAPDQAASDLAFAVCINTTNGSSGYAAGTDARSDGSVTVTLSANASTGDEIECYLFFSKEDFSKSSDSQYQQETV